MKIVADENIIYAEEAFGRFGDLSLLSGRSINNSMLKDADVLIVRSVTDVNEELLRGTGVKFVGTATIGTDHIDLDYLTQNGIHFADAKGCNSYAVAEFVLCGLTKLMTMRKEKFKDKSIGIIGVGNIGSKVKKIAESLGMKTVLNDPPLQRISNFPEYKSLEETLDCDIVTFHVPLNYEGTDKTFHLINGKNIGLIGENAIIINTSRGPVIDNNALRDRLIKIPSTLSILDVWENEPAISKELLRLVNLATPHIAGYSFEGKVNGTVIIYEALCDFLETDPGWTPDYPETADNIIKINKEVELTGIVSRICEHIYGMEEDDRKLKESVNFEGNRHASYFDELRKKYSPRREFNNYTLLLNNYNAEYAEPLSSLRLNVRKV